MDGIRRRPANFFTVAGEILLSTGSGCGGKVSVYKQLESELPSKLIHSRGGRTAGPQGTRVMLQGGVSADFVGSVRVFGIADKLLFDQLTRMDNQEMVM